MSVLKTPFIEQPPSFTQLTQPNIIAEIGLDNAHVTGSFAVNDGHGEEVCLRAEKLTAEKDNLFPIRRPYWLTVLIRSSRELYRVAASDWVQIQVPFV